jgi:exodeoxyribonuclease V beta subunit
VADYDPGAGPTAAGLDIHGFPRGTRAGRCLHALLERLCFTEPVAAQQALVDEQLARHGFESHWAPVLLESLQRTLETPLHESSPWRLAGLADTERLKELAFVYRVDRLGAADLQALLAEHGLDPGWLDNADFSPLRGFMRGVIDLVCRVEGRFQLLDYKSNWLGPGSADYHPGALQRAMRGGGYHLQYLIYTVALHRYLGWRVRGYDYASHFGGVYYLFLRGMDGQTPGAGVYYQRPPPALVLALDDYLILEQHPC